MKTANHNLYKTENISEDEALRRHSQRDFLNQNLILTKMLIFGGKFHDKTVRKFSGLDLFPNLTAQMANCDALYSDISEKLHFLLKISKKCSLYFIDNDPVVPRQSEAIAGHGGFH